MDCKVKICLLVAVWKRPEVTTACFHNIQRMIDYLPELFEIVPHIIVSEDWAEDLCREFGFDFTRHFNDPLGAKMNIGLIDAMNKEEWDWLMQLGSDDFVEPNFLDWYFPYFRSYSFFGQKSLVVVDAKSGEMKLIRTQEVFGALRCIRRDLLEACYPYWWDAHAQRGLDGCSMRRIQEVTGKVPTPVQGLNLLFDFKTEININPYEKTSGYPVSEVFAPLELRVLMKKYSAK